MWLNSFAEVPTVENAFFDRISLRLRSWVLSYTDEEALRQFCFNLGGRPHARREEQIQESPIGEGGPNAEHGFLFRAISLPDPARWKFEMPLFALGKNQMIGTPNLPLFTGALEFRLRTDRRNQSAIVTGNFSINPTRFLFHQDREERIVTGSKIPRTIDEQSLSCDDNLLIGRQRRFYRSATSRRDAVSRYWNLIRESLPSEFSRAGMLGHQRGQPIALSGTPSEISVGEVQVYWEVFSETAISKAHEICSILAPLPRSIDIETYPTESRGRIANCPNGKFQIIKGIGLKIYAKTERIVRLELTYSMPKVAGINRTGSVLNLHSVLQQVATDGAERMRSIFSYIRECEVNETQPASISELMRAVFDSVDDPAHAETILNLLFINHSLSDRLPASQTGSTLDLSRVIGKLRRKGVLQSGILNRAGVFPLCFRYHDLITRVSPLSFTNLH